MPMQAHPQHQPPQGQHLPHHSAMPMSPRNPAANLQPSTPTLPHALPTPVHAPIPHPSGSLGGLTPSPSPTIPTTKTLNATSSSFVPRKAVTVSSKTPDGVALVELHQPRTLLLHLVQLDTDKAVLGHPTGDRLVSASNLRISGISGLQKPGK